MLIRIFFPSSSTTNGDLDGSIATADQICASQAAGANQDSAVRKSLAAFEYKAFIRTF
jgi:hypothetical protein